MRRLLIVVFAAVVLSALSSPVALAADEDVIVVFEQHAPQGENVGDVDVGAMRVSSAGALLWSEGQRAVDIASSQALESNPRAMHDGVGGAIVAFELETRTGDNAGDTEIAAQRIDAKGGLMWNDGTKSVIVAGSRWAETNPVMVSDGQGGAIIFFEEHARDEKHAGDIDIGAQRVSASGEIQWGGGVRSAEVAASDRLERHPAAIPDGSGGAIVVFEMEPRSGDNAGDTEIYAQRLDSQGNRLWNNGESVMVASSTWGETNPVLVSDGQGGAIVVFEQRGRTVERSGDIDIGAQRLSPSGQLLWMDGQRAADVASADDIEQAPHMISDGLGGAIIVFEVEPRTGEHAGDTEVAGQRIGGDGALKWEGGSGHTLIAFSEWGEKKPIAVADDQGGAIVVFEQHARGGEHAGDIDVGAQRVSATGELLWGNEGERSVVVSSSKLLERSIAAVPSGSGGVLVAFEMEPRTGDNIGDPDIGAQLVNSAGNAVWNQGSSSVLVSSSKWGEKKPVLVGR
ncbi:MAG: hypothetical protein ACE149_17380 [Armatimonadota bacterium]